MKFLTGIDKYIWNLHPGEQKEALNRLMDLDLPLPTAVLDVMTGTNDPDIFFAGLITEDIKKIMSDTFASGILTSALSGGNQSAAKMYMFTKSLLVDMLIILSYNLAKNNEKGSDKITDDGNEKIKMLATLINEMPNMEHDTKTQLAKIIGIILEKPIIIESAKEEPPKSFYIVKTINNPNSHDYPLNTPILVLHNGRGIYINKNLGTWRYGNLLPLADCNSVKILPASDVVEYWREVVNTGMNTIMFDSLIAIFGVSHTLSIVGTKLLELTSLGNVKKELNNTGVETVSSDMIWSLSEYEEVSKQNSTEAI